MKNHHLIHHAESAQSDAAAIKQPSGPTHDAIARRAYEIYVEKGLKQGHCMQNWQQAERDLIHTDNISLVGAAKPAEAKPAAEGRNAAPTKMNQSERPMRQASRNTRT